MNENSKFIKFIKKILKKEIEQNEEVKENIDENIVSDTVDKQNIENKEEINSVKENIKDSQEEINLYTENINVDEFKNLEINEIPQSVESEDAKDKDIKDIENNLIKNIKIERMVSSMGDTIKIKNSNPCEITNKLNQALLKIPKHLVTTEQLDAVKATVNLGHVDNQEFLDVAFKYSKEIDNPCGEGTIQGEALLKAVVIVSTIGYSFILYDSITKEILYDMVQDAITAYTVYDIIPFEEDKRPNTVTPQFTVTRFELLPDDPVLDYYVFLVEGTVDLIGAE